MNRVLLIILVLAILATVAIAQRYQLCDNSCRTSGAVEICCKNHGLRNNRYYTMTSHLTGWTPNPGELFIINQDNLQNAKWLSLRNPTNSSSTFNSQSIFVLSLSSTKYPETVFYIYIGDLWNYPDLLNASYICLSFTFNSDPNVTLQWKDQ